MLPKEEQKRWIAEAKMEVNEDVRQARMIKKAQSHKVRKRNNGKNKGPAPSQWRGVLFEYKVMPMDEPEIEKAGPVDKYKENDEELGESPEDHFSTQE